MGREERGRAGSVGYGGVKGATQEVGGNGGTQEVGKWPTGQGHQGREGEKSTPLEQAAQQQRVSAPRWGVPDQATRVSAATPVTDRESRTRAPARPYPHPHRQKGMVAGHSRSAHEVGRQTPRHPQPQPQLPHSPPPARCGLRHHARPPRVAPSTGAPRQLCEPVRPRQRRRKTRWARGRPKQCRRCGERAGEEGGSEEWGRRGRVWGEGEQGATERQGTHTLVDVLAGPADRGHAQSGELACSSRCVALRRGAARLARACALAWCAVDAPPYSLRPSSPVPQARPSA